MKDSHRSRVHSDVCARAGGQRRVKVKIVCGNAVGSDPRRDRRLAVHSLQKASSIIHHGSHRCSKFHDVSGLENETRTGCGNLLGDAGKIRAMTGMPRSKASVTVRPNASGQRGGTTRQSIVRRTGRRPHSLERHRMMSSLPAILIQPVRGLSGHDQRPTFAGRWPRASSRTSAPLGPPGDQDSRTRRLAQRGRLTLAGLRRSIDGIPNDLAILHRTSAKNPALICRSRMSRPTPTAALTVRCCRRWYFVINRHLIELRRKYARRETGIRWSTCW